MDVQDLMLKSNSQLKGYEIPTSDEVDMLLDLEEEHSRSSSISSGGPSPDGRIVATKQSK